MMCNFLLRKPVHQALVVGFWAALAFVGTVAMLPSSALPPQLFVFDIWDKAQHALTFTVLGIWGLMIYPLRPWRVLLGLLCFGGAIELAQALTSWRFADWHDWLADGIGLALATALAWSSRQRLASGQRGVRGTGTLQ